MAEHRFDCAVRLNSDGDGPRRLVATLLRFGTIGANRNETFAAGALQWPANGIAIDIEHLSERERGARVPPVLRAIPFEADGELRIDAPIPDSTAGRDLIAMLSAEPPVLDSMSIVYRPLREHYEGAVLHVDSGLLDSAGVVGRPAFPGTSARVNAAAERRLLIPWL